MSEKHLNEGSGGNQLNYENGKFPISFNGTLNLNQINIYNSCGPLQNEGLIEAKAHLPPRPSQNEHEGAYSTGETQASL